MVMQNKVYLLINLVFIYETFNAKDSKHGVGLALPV